MQISTDDQPHELRAAATGEPTASPGLTRGVIAVADSYWPSSLPEDIVDLAKHCLLDWLGVTLAGSVEQVSRILLAQARVDGSQPVSSVVGHDAKVSVPQACLINGTASHSQDYDDVLEMMLGHPSAPVAPVVMALGERGERSGAEVLTAFVAGVQAEAMIGALVEPYHHEQGWHTTATLGTFGAAAAACHLLGLDLEQWNRAFGIAATSAGGLKSMFGTMCKPLHAGQAAARGYFAASAAAQGMTSTLDVLDVERGFIDVTTPRATRPGGLAPDRFAIREVLFKSHAACYLTHSAIEGALELVRAHRLAPSDIARIDLQLLPVHDTTCAFTDARTPLEAKFSLEYATAIAVVAGRAGEREFSDERVQDPQIRALASRVVRHFDGSSTRQMATPVQITTTDGRVLSTRIDVGAPAAATGLVAQWDRLVDKFSALAAPVVGSGRAAELVELVGHFDELDDVTSVLALTTPVSAPGE